MRVKEKLLISAARFSAAAIVVCCLACIFASKGQGEVTTPRVTPVWAGTPPKIDGRLNEEIWAYAPHAAGFQTSAGVAKWKTKAWIALDNEAFYVAFDCDSPATTPPGINKEVGLPFWKDESVEMFIAPWGAPDKQSIYQFVVNAAGVKTFLRARKKSSDDLWAASATARPGGWSAEMRIPLAIFKTHGRNEASWRILFGRNSKTDDHSSSFPKYNRRFGDVWAYARLAPVPGRPSFLTLRGMLVPLVSPEGLGGAQPLKAALNEAEPPLIIPQPVYSRFTGARFPLTRRTVVVLGDNATRIDARAGEVLADWIDKKCGFRPKIERASAGPSPLNRRERIIVGEPGLNPSAKALLEKSGDTVNASAPGPEGYVIRITGDSVVAAGSDQPGTFWAAQTLAQMIQGDGEGRFWLAGGLVIDRPAMAFRGVHLTAAKDTLAFQTKLIREILSPFKINFVILQMNRYDWQSHPELVDPANRLSREDLRKLIALGKEYRITFIPLVPSLGHMGWVFRDGINRDIAEDPERPFAYCPLNPRSYQLIEELFDEAYDLFGRPGYFHIGHDEFDMVGEFPTHTECKKLGKVELYYRDTLKLVAFLKEKGARVMMWGDILHKPEFVGRFDELPKDVIIADWHYGEQQVYPSIDLFRNHGHEVLGASWYLPRNIYYFSKFAAAHNALGMMQTTWTWKTADVTFQKWPEQMFQYVLGAEWSWSPGKPPIDAMTYDADQVFNARWWPEGSPEQGVNPASGTLFSIDFIPAVNVSTCDSDGNIGWIGAGPGVDLSKLGAGVQHLGKMTYRVLSGAGGQASAVMLRGPDVTSAYPTSVNGIKIGSEAKQLWFLHTTAYPDAPGSRIGAYVVHYRDGAEETIPLQYGENVAAWNYERPTKTSQAAWRSGTSDGQPVRLWAMPWTNPHPEKVIDTIDFRSEPGSQASPVLLAITGVR